MIEKRQIVIIGGGYAGIMAAVRLAGKTRGQDITITLINSGEQFIERPKLHEVATGSRSKPRPLNTFLAGTGIILRLGWVTGLDPQRRAVTVDGEAGPVEIGYDFLLYSLGSRVDRQAVPGIQEYAYTLDAGRPRDAVALHEALANLAQRGGAVSVVGSGATGIEAAAEIADCFPTLKVSVYTRGPMGTFTSPRVTAYMRGALQRLGVEIREYAPVTRIVETGLHLQDGSVAAHDLCLWAGGFRGQPLARAAGLSVNERDQILVDPYLRAVSHDTIYAIGDAGQTTHDTGAPLRMSLFTALVTAAHAADNLARRLEGQEERLFSFSTFGQGIALGRRDAVGFNTFPDDRPVGPLFTGRLGLSVRNFFVWLILQILFVERRFPGFFFWFGRRRGHPEQTTNTMPAPKPARTIAGKPATSAILEESG